jgi:hypothetical protein
MRNIRCELNTVFDGRALALDETAEVKEEDVRNKSTKLM